MITLKLFGIFPTKDMQTLHPLSFDPVFMDDAQCAETNEKLIFRFLFFESWSFLYSKLPIFDEFFDHNSKNKNRKNLKIGSSF